jgi:opacity protein-like surface antigen
VAVLGAGALLAGLCATSAQASTVTINPANPEPGFGNNFPFGVGNIWPPYAGFVYKNVPAFSLKTGDKVAFDLGAQNDVDIQLQIDMAATTVNGGDTQAPAGFTTLVPNTVLPQNPRGDTTNGDYEMQFPVQIPFNFPGGGLIIRFSNPGGAFAGDTNGSAGVLVNRATSADTSNNFVERFNGDTDGGAPWSNAFPGEIGGFRLTIADSPTSGSGNNPSAHTKCKKKKHRSASASKKRKCKKKHR